MTSYPKVAIVGRTNVGKSTLFNRLSNKEQSIVFSQEGVTRDYIHEIVSWNDKTFDLIDTGGLPLTKQDDIIWQQVEQSVQGVIEKTDLILLVCDIKNGIAIQDRAFAKLLHKTKKPVFLVLNKADNIAALRENEHEFCALGFQEHFLISATHGKGIRELLDAITTKIENTRQLPEEPTYKVVILGKPNVGKSSLLNLLIKEQRAIVSQIAGTTREAISETISFHKDLVQITDTAGIRRKSRVDDPLEGIMVKSSLYAVRSADIVLVVIDSTSGQLSDQELKLLFYAFEQKKSIILIINKTDILDDQHKSMLEHDLERYNFFIKKIQILKISCLTNKNVGSVFKEIQKARQRRMQTFEIDKVNEIIKQALIQKPMYHKTLLLKIMHVKPIENSLGAPGFVLYVNYPQWFGPTQLGFIENILRKNYDFLGCPIQFNVRKV